MSRLDEQMMARCVELARKAEGRTAPNPIVGCVVVNDAGEIVGEGYHQKRGEPHAEVYALDEAGDKARGATAYVSLEPCCHFGKTGPCSKRLIEAGVRRVVCGLEDPNPKVAGGGIAELRAAGISVEVGILEKECRYLNRAWLKWITQDKMPWVILKTAATLDGKIADRSDKSKWITGAHARQWVHEQRNRVDCVMIGGKTAFVDDAQLTTRDVKNGRNPIRAIVDTQLRLHPESKLANNPDGKTWVFTSAESIANKGGRFTEHVKLIETPLEENGTQLNLHWVLKYLGAENVLSVMCEGGSALSSSLLHHADELYWMVAPKILGDPQSVPAVVRGESLIEHIKPYTLNEVVRVGDDVLIKMLIERS